MVREGFICDVCGLAGTDRAIVEAHEKTPIVGLDLTIGGVYKARDPNHLIIIAQLQPYTKDHVRRYSNVGYSIERPGKYLHESGGMDPVEDILRMGRWSLLEEENGLYVLTPKQYALARKLLLTPKEHDMNFPDNDVTYYAPIELIRHIAQNPKLQLSRGVLK
jgi:hypothetical protein